MGDVAKVVKKVVKSPFSFVKNVGRAADSLAQGDLKGTLRYGINAGADFATATTGMPVNNAVGEGGSLVDTTPPKPNTVAVAVEPEVKSEVSFGTTSNPDVVVGADDVDEKLNKKKKKSASKGTTFLGGVSGSSNLLI